MPTGKRDGVTVKIGTVPYLNEKPLTRWFGHTDEGKESGVQIVAEVPSRLAQMLRSGEIAAALVSSFAGLMTPDYAIVPGVSISGQGDILSVRAFSKVAWPHVQSVALDTSSLTSSALLKIILAERYNAFPAFVHHAPDLDQMLTKADAALLIGDNGMLAPSDGLHVLDLGREWRKLTGGPFVYAVWLGKPENVTPFLVNALNTAKAWGLTQLTEIAEEQAERLHCPADLCLHYLTDIMDYDLDDAHVRALHLFGEKAHALGLLPNVPAIAIAKR